MVPQACRMWTSFLWGCEAWLLKMTLELAKLCHIVPNSTPSVYPPGPNSLKSALRCQCSPNLPDPVMVAIRRRIIRLTTHRQVVSNLLSNIRMGTTRTITHLILQLCMVLPRPPILPLLQGACTHLSHPIPMPTPTCTETHPVSFTSTIVPLVHRDRNFSIPLIKPWYFMQLPHPTHQCQTPNSPPLLQPP